MRVVLFYCSVGIFLIGLLMLVALEQFIETDEAALTIPIILCIVGVGLAAYISCFPEVQPERPLEEVPLTSPEIESLADV